MASRALTVARAGISFWPAFSRMSRRRKIVVIAGTLVAVALVVIVVSQLTGPAGLSAYLFGDDDGETGFGGKSGPGEDCSIAEC